MSSTHPGLPVAGYQPQPNRNVELVNFNKAAEEHILRMLDGLALLPDVDQEWLATGRAGIEAGFMAVNCSIFKPARVSLPGDTE